VAWGTILAGIAVLAMAVSWYGLQVAALRDLRERPRVRADNKVLWAFVILCAPYVGPLVYMTMGPTSSLPRPQREPVASVPAPGLRASTVLPAPSAPVAMATPRTVAGGRPARTPYRHRSFGESRHAVATAHHTDLVSRDPVIGTDMVELVQRRSVITPLSAPGDTAIRWPGSTGHAMPPAMHEFRD
jgi:hypothetical protein